MVLLFMQLVSLPWLVLAGHGVSASTVVTLPWCISEVGENVSSVICRAPGTLELLRSTVFDPEDPPSDNRKSLAECGCNFDFRKPCQPTYLMHANAPSMDSLDTRASSQSS
jgi:hypothetical protein